MNLKIMAFVLMTSSMVSMAHATPITNKIIGIGPATNKINPYFCIQNQQTSAITPVAPNQTLADGNAASGNKYYVGGALRFGGCSESNTYLGYLGYNSAGQVTYSPPTGSHVTCDKPAYDGSNLSGNVKYTEIKANFDLLPKPPRPNASWNFVGVNLSGMEFGKAIEPFTIPNLSKEDASAATSDLTKTQAFLTAGMNTVRVPISWSYVQLEGPGVGDINPDYFDNFIKPMLESLTSTQVYAILDLHAYMRYAEFGKQTVDEGKLITDPKAFQDVWVKLFNRIKADPKINMNYVMLDLVNEPFEAPDDSVFKVQTETIKSLRQAGFQGYILVEGNNWSGLHSWLNKTWKSTDGKTTYSNGTLFTKDNFAKAGIVDTSKILINVHQYLDANYSGTTSQCLTDLNTTGENGFNLKVFVDYLQQNHLKAIVTEFGGGKDVGNCSTAMTQFLNYLKDNAVTPDKDYGFVGWTIWSTGHAWGDGYILLVTPSSYQMKVMQNYLQEYNYP